MIVPSTTNFRQRVMKAGIWSIVGYGFNYAFRLVSNLVMTRLLAPEAFGLIAMAGLVMAGLAMFSDFGIKPSVIQSKRGDDPAFLNTAFTLQVLRGGVLFFAALLICLILSIASGTSVVPPKSVYANPILPLVIATFAVTSIIAGYESTKALQASRTLQIGKLTRIEIVAQIIGFAVMIVWASLDRSIWALVVGAIASSLARTVLTHSWLVGCRNRITWDHGAYKEIMSLGKWLFLSSLLFFVASNGDRLFLAGVVDSATLGAYSIAFLIFSSIEQMLNRVVVDVSYPALTEVIRNDRHRLATIYYRFHAPIAGTAYFCAGALLVSGQTVISVLYDQRYQSAGWILQILSLALAAFPFRIASQSFLALDLAKTYFQLNLSRVASLAILAALGFHFFGFEGCVWGIALSYFASVPLILYHARQSGLLSFWNEIKVLPAIGVGAFVGFLFNAVFIWAKT